MLLGVWGASQGFGEKPPCYSTRLTLKKRVSEREETVRKKRNPLVITRAQPLALLRRSRGREIIRGVEKTSRHTQNLYIIGENESANLQRFARDA